jgi:hypothetical protein
MTKWSSRAGGRSATTGVADRTRGTSKAENLLDRLVRHRAEVSACKPDFTVPFDTPHSQKAGETCVVRPQQSLGLPVIPALDG